MSNSNQVSNMSDKEFNNKMYEIFNNTCFTTAIEKIWTLYNGDLDGCKQFLAYCKHVNYLQNNDDEAKFLSMWSNKSVKELELEAGCGYHFTEVTRKNGVLISKNYWVYELLEGSCFKEIL